MSGKAVLTIIRNGETLKSQPIEGEAIIGRGEGCVIRLEDRAVSRQHAVLRPSASGIQVEKKSEFAPLVVNGAECSKALLKDGDVISIGPFLMKLQLDAGKTNATPASPEASVPATAESAPANENPQAPVDGVPGMGEVQAADPNPIPGMGEVAAVTELPGTADAPISLDGTASPTGLEPGAADAPGVADAIIDDNAKTRVTTAAKLLVKLVFQPGTANYTEYVFEKDECSVGRGKNCDIVLNDKKSSRKHAIIRRAGLTFVIKDLDSANGTFVNGVKVQEQELSGEDVVRIGEVEFQFRAMSADYAAQEKNFASVPAEEAVPIATEQAVAPAVPGQLPGQLEGLGTAVPGVPGAVPGDGASVPGITNVPGMGSPKKKASLYQKYIKNFKNLSPKQKIIVVVLVGGLFLFLMSDDNSPVTDKKPKPKPTAVASAGPVTFESLSPEKKRFVESQYNLAFDLYRSKEYDRAIFEVKRIFELVPDYKDAKEILRYAEEGKRKLEALEEERKKKEDEERLKAKIKGLVEETQDKMSKKQYEAAKELFIQIVALDPDNAQIAVWKKEIDDFEEQKRLEAQQKQVQAEINKRAWEMLEEGYALKKQGKCHSAIEVFSKVPDIGASDKRVSVKAKAAVTACHSYIKSKREPVLAEAKQAEAAQEYSKAFQLYKKATQIDPPHPAGYAGMSRIRNILHERAKVLYTEAILAESYSDFAGARKKYQECLDVAPEDDIYHERAKSKLNRYFNSQYLKKEE